MISSDHAHLWLADSLEGQNRDRCNMHKKGEEKRGGEGKNVPVLRAVRVLLV